MRTLAVNALAIIALAATPLVAQTASFPGQPVAARVAAGTYHVDSGHTQVLFTVNHMGFTQYTGQFTQPTGSLTLDPKNPAKNKVEVTFQIANVATTVPGLNAHLQKPEFFDAAKFPEGKFVSTKVIVKGSTATIQGNLTLKGVTKPVTLAARFVGAGNGPMGAKKPNIGFTATTSINRSDFGVDYLTALVSDKVDLTINAGFEAE